MTKNRDKRPAEQGRSRRRREAASREKAVGAREHVVGGRERRVSAREDQASVRESAVGEREELSRLREEAVHAREEADDARAQREQLVVAMREANQNLVLASLRAQELAEEADRARAEMEASETRFRTLATALAEVVWTTNSEGLVEADSPSWRRFTGQTYEQFKGSGWLDAIHPDDRQRIGEAWSNAIAREDTIENECRVRRPDGSYTWTVARGAAVRDADGTIREWVGTNTDISAKRKLAEDARQSADRFRSMAESMPQKIFTATPNGERDYFNRQWTEFTGHPIDEFKGSGWLQFVHPDDVASLLRAWRRCIETGDPFQFEYRLRRADGVYHWHLGRAHAIRDADGTIVMWIGSNTDIDEMKGVEKALHAADQKKDEFLAMLGHELRNPLAPILTALQLMNLRGQAKGAEHEREVIERQVRHVARLVDDLLDVARITRGRIELQRDKVEIALVIAKAVEMASPLIERRGHHLSVDAPSVGLMVDVDPARMAQVVANLLNNAAKFTPPGGDITVTARSQGASVEVSVVDTGAGLAPEVLPRMFEMFVQGETTRERSEGGLGLGLALVRSLVMMHGGTVKAESEGLGKGSVFTISLPWVRQEVLAEEPAATLSPMPIAAEVSKRILVVDDNEDAADTLGDILRLTGHEVKVVYDGPQAMVAAESFAPDVALVDLGLPVMDGFEVARRLRELPVGAGLRLIAVTGYGQEGDKARSRAAGFDAHLVKPVTVRALIEAIEGGATHREASPSPEAHP